jgi:hypothetical protein
MKNMSSGSNNDYNQWEQLSFPIRGLKRLSAKEIEQRREAGRKGGNARAEKLTPAQRQEIGRKGYRAAIAKEPDFHYQGAAVTTKLYAYTSPESGAVGYEAAVSDKVWEPRNKKHRYYGQCKCHNQHRD